MFDDILKALTLLAGGWIWTWHLRYHCPPLYHLCYLITDWLHTYGLGLGIGMSWAWAQTTHITTFQLKNLKYVLVNYFSKSRFLTQVNFFLSPINLILTWVPSSFFPRLVLFAGGMKFVTQIHFNLVMIWFAHSITNMIIILVLLILIISNYVIKSNSQTWEPLI